MVFSQQRIFRPLYGNDTVNKFLGVVKTYDPDGFFMNTNAERALENQEGVTEE